MKVCARCGYVITGQAAEYTPDSTSGARPTTYHHASDALCNAATLARRETATYTPRPRRRP